MPKKLRVLISVILAVLLVVVGTTVVLAQEEPEPTLEAEANGLIARVAQILDISKKDLIDAFEQAKQEMGEEWQARLQERRQETINRALDRAVERECLIQDEADEIMEWSQQRSEVMNRMRFNRFCAPQALGQRYMWKGHGGGGYGPGMFEQPAD